MNSNLVTAGIALGICFAVQKFVKNQSIKAMALGVAGTVIAKQVPYLQNALA